MQSYDGPKNRKLTKFNGEYGFRKDGRVNYLENREIYMTQTFDIEEVITTDSVVPDYWFFKDEEDIVSPKEGAVLKIKEVHQLNRLCLNQTLTNLRFKPDNSFNSLEIDTECQIRLAPLLSDKTVFNNVTRIPEELIISERHREDSVSVLLHAYNRFWFGFIQDNEAENRFSSTFGGYDAAAGAVSFDLSQASGFLLRVMNQEQELLDGPVHWDHNSGNMWWDYDPILKRFHMENKKIIVPMHIF